MDGREKGKSRESTPSEKDAFSVVAPTISLPKGGGAIRGIGEKFAANPVTGTGSMTVPIAVSPGRSGFGPQLSLSYDSGAGNGPFGLGWHLSLPSITRKTDKGLPRYQDGDESDVFILSGAEDLVPALKKEPSGEWFRDAHGNTERDEALRDGHLVQRYQPRIEGVFARIERWRHPTDPSDTHWRSISRDNVTTFYGKTSNSRIVDPADPGRIFAWLICESFDDKGNELQYQYKAEDDREVDRGQANERNRTVGANRYLKNIYYGNRTSRLAPPVPGQSKWLFEVVFDYGEHSETDPTPGDLGVWPCRRDPFSTYRAGFEVRTYRLCRRVLMFHHFPEEDIGSDCLIRSADFGYHDPLDPTAAFIASVTQTGYKRAKPGAPYLSKSLPPLEFEYTAAKIDDQLREVDADSLENLPIGLDGVGYQWVDLDGEGISGIFTEQADAWFYKRNLSPISTVKEADGILRTVPTFAPMKLVAQKPVFAATGTGGWQFQDLAGTGRPALVQFAGPVAGFFQRSPDDKWADFVAFGALPNVSWRDPNLRFLDLTGDGLADILITGDDGFTWYPSLGETGFARSERTVRTIDEERGPRLVFADGEQAIYLADLSGDGLTDLVRIRNGEICYWPNLGYGCFGARVTMDNAPWFDAPDQFSQRRLRLADIDGSGLVDIIYLGRGGISVFFNQSGNSWSAAKSIDQVPQVDDLTAVQVVDLFGNGTACLVWSSPLAGNAQRSMRYIDLMGGQKPHLLVKTRNNLGAETQVQYAASTKFYLADKAAGKPWITKLPFPVHVVEKVTVTDKWRNTTFASTSSYHHGYFDGVEREFRGFGRVEQVDVESFGKFAAANQQSPYITKDKTLYQPPVRTVTWFHTGASLDRQRILTQFESEYFPHWLAELPIAMSIDQEVSEKPLPEPDLAREELNADEWREALRACKGMTLRQEVCELDVAELEATGKQIPVRLFSIATHNCDIRRLQPQGCNPHAVFLVAESEALNYHYDLDLRAATPGKPLEPDPRIAHTLNLRFDVLGNVEQSIAVGYERARVHEDSSLDPQQLELIGEVQEESHVTYSETHFTNDAIDTGAPDPYYRLRRPWEALTYELTGLTPEQGRYFSVAELQAYHLSETLDHQGTKTVKPLEYHQRPTASVRPTINPPERRKVEHVITLFFDETLTTPLGHGELNRLGLTYETYKLALTRPLLRAILGSKFSGDIETALNLPTTSGYRDGAKLMGSVGADQWWIRSGIAGFADEADQHFYLPVSYQDPFGNETTLAYHKPYYLFVQSSTDALGNRTGVFTPGSPERPRFDYRMLAPVEMEDLNGNRTEICFDVLGMVVAVAVKGKGTEADNLSGYTDSLANPDLAEVLQHFDPPELTAEEARAWFAPPLANATMRFLYHFGEKITATGVAWAHRPAGACTIMRERHVASLPTTDSQRTPLQVAFECSDGMGTVLMKRSQAEPDVGTPHLRWIVSGKTVLNNKGKPVKQYEPYFSVHAGCSAEGDVHEEVGVTPLMYYDAAGRLVRTEMPDGTISRVTISPWYAKAFDANDCVKESRWYRERLTSSERAPDSQVIVTEEEEKARSTPVEDKRAALLAAQHANTPAVTILDSLGREVIAVAHNRYIDGAGTARDEKYLTFTKLDAEGKALWIRDARGNLVMQYIQPPIADGHAVGATAEFVPCYDIAGNLLFQHSMDAGDRWILNDAAGKPMFAWDFNERQEGSGFVGEERFYTSRYDALHRPTGQWLAIGTTTTAAILADRPIGYWHLREAPGSAIAADAGSQEHNGTYAGGITLGLPGFGGDSGTAALFDGVTGRIVVPNSPILNPARITMEAKIRWDGPTTVQQRILEKESFAGVTQYGLSIGSDGHVQVKLRMRVSGAPVAVGARSVGVVEVGTRTHVAATYDGQVIRIYRNAILDSATIVNASPIDLDVKPQLADPEVDLAIGDRIGLIGPAHRTFNGLLGEVALFDQALTDAQILSHYQPSSAPPRLVERFEYLDATVLGTFSTVAEIHSRNLCGQLYKHYDPSGMVQTDRIDFKGSPLEVRRQLVADYKESATDWSNSPEAKLETEVFYQTAEYDALKRMTLFYSWHRLTAINQRVAIYNPHYSERGLLDGEDLVLRARKIPGDFDPAGSKGTAVIEAIAYDAKGQRQAIRYGNGTSTRFTYDPQTFRLVQLRTTRRGHDPAFSRPRTSTQLKDANVLQNLYYTYDPVGNITEIYDDAYEIAFFKNQAVEPRSRYIYDALYRLIAATGREHIRADDAPGPSEGAPLSVTFPVGNTDPNCLRTYDQRYQYDPVGNILEMRHSAGEERWKRSYQVADHSNRLSKTWLGSDTGNATVHEHDTHGNMRSLANVAAEFYLRWDHRDMLKAFNRGGGGWVYYQYDTGKQRTRKVSEDQSGTKTWERIYLGGMEIYRRYAGGMPVEETESHHVFNGEHRVLIVEDVLRTNTTGAVTGALYRYQYGNHLGSACLELDDGASVITYEEYHPYGTSAYRTARSRVEAPKRYRYTGMERDEESGLGYHTARHYAPWLARWLTVDPTGVTDGVNAIQYCRGNPSRLRDSTGEGGIEENKPVADALRIANAEKLREDGRMILEETTLRSSQTGKTLKDVGPIGPDVEDPRRGQGIRTRRQHDIVELNPKSKTSVSFEQVTTAEALKHRKKTLQAIKDEAGRSYGGINMPGRGEVYAVHLDPATGDMYRYVGSATIVGALPDVGPSGKLGPIALDVSPTLVRVIVLDASGSPVAGADAEVGIADAVAVEKQSARRLEQTAEHSGASAARIEAEFSERSAARVGEHVPVLGAYIALDLIEEDIRRRRYWDAAADFVGPIPGIGEVAWIAQIGAHNYEWFATAVAMEFYQRYPTPLEFFSKAYSQ